MINAESINQITNPKFDYPWTENINWRPLYDDFIFRNTTPLFNYLRTEFDLKTVKMLVNNNANVNHQALFEEYYYKISILQILLLNYAY